MSVGAFDAPVTPKPQVLRLLVVKCRSLLADRREDREFGRNGLSKFPKESAAEGWGRVHVLGMPSVPISWRFSGPPRSCSRSTSRTEKDTSEARDTSDSADSTIDPTNQEAEL